MESTEIIRQCQEGNWNNFEDLYRLYSPKALGMAYLISGHRSIAEDIVQEAFSICFCQIGKLRNPETFHVWFYRVLVRVGWKMTKDGKSLYMEDLAPTADDSSLMVEDPCESNSDRLIVRRAIRKLPIQYKNVIMLYYFNEFSIKQISNVLGCFQGTVKSRLYKARKLLQKELEEAYHGEFSSVLNQKGEVLNG